MFLLGAIAAIIVGMSKGGLPGIGMIAVPVMSLSIPPTEAAGLLLPIYVVTDLFAVWSYRHEYDRRNLKILIPGSMLGIAIGWATARVVSQAIVTLAVGLIGITFFIYISIPRRKPPPARPADWPRGLFWGALTGFTSFVSHSGAPPYQVYALPQRLGKMAYAGTTTLLFAVVNAMKLVPYWALGQLSAANLEVAAALIPIGIASTLVTVRIVRLVNVELFFRLVQLALCLISAKLVFDGVRALLK